MRKEEEDEEDDDEVKKKIHEKAIRFFSLSENDYSFLRCEV